MSDKKIGYRQQVDAKRIQKIRCICSELPQACGDFISGIALTTGTFTRLAYATDLRTFFQYLHNERVSFADKKLTLLTDQDLACVTRADLDSYVEYLTYYYKDNGTEDHPKEMINHEKSIKRKLCAIRSMYDYLFKLGRIQTNVTQLVDLPKIHEKPIIRLDEQEMKRILHES